MALAPNPSNSLEYIALTDVGMRRANNQDAHAEVIAPDADSWQRRGHLFVVCDGMGAHAAGELASKMAADGIPHTYLKLRDRSPVEALHKSIEVANSQIHTRGEANADFQGMGTTASALVLLPQGAIVAHVGDSRVYRLRGSRLEQLTFDHSLVWEMSAAGHVPKDALPGFVPKNIITRSLGPHADVKIDLEGPFELAPGDTFLLCSDGLTGQVQDEEIGDLLQCLSPAEAAQVLIDLANLRGGPDNITLIIARWKNGVASAPAAANSATSAPGNGPSTAPESLRTAKPLMLAALACVLIAVGLGALQATIPTLIALAVGIALALIGWFQPTAQPAPPASKLTPGARLGRGPHSMTDCRPSAKFANDLVSMIEQLREAAIEEHWSIDWNQFNELCQSGKRDVDQQDFCGAVRHYAAALQFMMGELRHQRARPNDPTVDEQPT
jgi:PPM family protein phosphatase